MKLTRSTGHKLIGCILIVTAAGLYSPLVVQAAPSYVAYFAVYCSKGGGLSTTYAQDNVLKCHNSGSNPLFEAKVDSLNSNPNGTHFVTIVGADCYPNTSQVPSTPNASTDRIKCGKVPDATLTLGSTFPPAAAAAATPPPAPAPPLLATPLKVGDLPQVNADSSTIQTVLGIVFGIAGALALLVITLSGFRYITSAGNPEKTARAKNGIIYALVGLVVAVSAEAIVGFVGNRL